MPWQGYNFEDSILITERIVKDDVFTSIHIEEFECVARDTKLGKEEITRDIPNVGEEALKDLDESGIVRIGAEVKPGDILVGKITPKGETQLSPEEKLLRAIFGEKAGDVRDTRSASRRACSGIVINAQVFARKGTEKDERAKAIEDDGGGEARSRTRTTRSRSSATRLRRRSASCSSGKTTDGKLVDDKGKVLLKKGDVARRRAARRRSRSKYWGEIPVDDDVAGRRSARSLAEPRGPGASSSKLHFREKIERLKKGDELPPGVIKMVKVYIAIKRKLQVGDKMAGRHGNKGVVSPHPARRGHAVPRGRHAGRHRAQPARRSVPHERRPDPRDAPRLGARTSIGEQHQAT